MLRIKIVPHVRGSLEKLEDLRGNLRAGGTKASLVPPPILFLRYKFQEQNFFKWLRTCNNQIFQIKKRPIQFLKKF